jgi:hypothetical protein
VKENTIQSGISNLNEIKYKHQLCGFWTILFTSALVTEAIFFLGPLIYLFSLDGAEFKKAQIKLSFQRFNNMV